MSHTANPTFFERGGLTTARQPTAAGEAERVAAFAGVGVPLTTTTGAPAPTQPAQDTTELFNQAVDLIKQLTIAPPPPQEFTQEQLGLNIPPEFATEGAIIPVGEKRFRITPTGSLVDITPIAGPTAPVVPVGALTTVPPTVPSPTAPADIIAQIEIERIRIKIAEQSAKIASGLTTIGRTRILEEVFRRFGVEEELTIVSALNQEIFRAQEEIRAIPDAIKEGLENIGISENQLLRLSARELVKPRQALARLLEVRGLSQARIDQALRLSTMFANTIFEDKMAQIDAQRFMLSQLEGEFAELKGEQKEVLERAFDEKDDIADIANDVRRRGGSEELVGNILDSPDRDTAIQRAAAFVPPPTPITPEDPKIDEFLLAEEFVASRPDATDEELESSLIRDSDLSPTEINAIIANRPKKVTLGDEELKSLAIRTIEDSFEKKAFTFRKTELQNTKDFIKKNLDAVLKILGKDKITPSDKEALLIKIETITLDDIEI